jgi:hypothetical protein
MTEPRSSSALTQDAAGAATEEPDRRRFPRRRIRDMLLVQPVLGEVVDMSAGGVAVLTWDALPVHKELFLSFGPPGQRVRVRARVIWCRLRATEPGIDWTPKYRAGIQFLEFPA